MCGGRNGYLNQMPKAAKELTVRSLIRDLKSKDSGVREEAAHDLGEMGPAAKVSVQALIRALDDEDCWVPSTAAVALGKIGLSAEKVIPRLVVLLADTSTLQQSKLMDTIASFGTAALPELKKALRNDNVEQRVFVIKLVGQIETSCQATIAILHDAVKDIHSRVRIAGVEALAQKGKSGLDELITALADKHSLVRVKSAQALGALGSAAKKAVKALKKMDGDRMKEVKVECAKAIQAITADEHDCAQEG